MQIQTFRHSLRRLITTLLQHNMSEDVENYHSDMYLYVFLNFYFIYILYVDKGNNY